MGGQSVSIAEIALAQSVRRGYNVDRAKFNAANLESEGLTLYTVKDIYDALNGWAPFDTGYRNDIKGLLAGRFSSPVKRVFASLDITPGTIREALGIGAQLIVSHHAPFLSPPLPTDGSPAGEVLLELCENRLGAISAHTNLDAAPGGVNDELASLLGLPGGCQPLDDEGIGRWGGLPRPIEPQDLASLCKDKLGCGVVRFFSAGKPVSRLAICGGSGGDMLAVAAAKGCHALVTADIKHHQFIQAAQLGISLLDCGHFATENIIIPKLCAYLEKQLPGIEARQSRVSKEPYQCL
ncbi:MAG: Nif3-like dinuclear metal center hexameric protein [Oscillospiraceae bacterium]|nr:Nif3-like dinuclear metal center hexameric protein [Oscillospiraceae bacterium]